MTKTPSSKLPEKIESWKQELEANEKMLKRLLEEKLKVAAKELLKEFKSCLDFSVLITEVRLEEADLNPLFERLKKEKPEHLIILGWKGEDRCLIKIGASIKAQSSGFKADELLKKGLSLIQGTGGGKAMMAQGVGKHPSGLDDFFAYMEKELKSACR